MIKITKKNIFMSFKPFTEKNNKNKNGICSGSISGPGSGSVIPEADPDPHQNETDSKHCK